MTNIGNQHPTIVILIWKISLKLDCARLFRGVQTPQVLIHVPLNFFPKSLPQLNSPTAFMFLPSPPQISVPRFPILFPSFSPSSLSLLQPPIYSNGIFARLTHSLTPLRPRSHRRRRRRTRRRATADDGGGEGRTALSPPLTRSFLRSLSFNGKGCSCVLPPSLACFVPLARM